MAVGVENRSIFRIQECATRNAVILMARRHSAWQQKLNFRGITDSVWQTKLLPPGEDHRLRGAYYSSLLWSRISLALTWARLAMVVLV